MGKRIYMYLVARGGVDLKCFFFLFFFFSFILLNERI